MTNKPIFRRVLTGIATVFLGLLSTILYNYWIKHLIENKIPVILGNLAQNTPWLLFLGSVIYIVILRNRFLRLGVIKLHGKAGDTINRGIQEADESYYWLGASAYYVVCNPTMREDHILSKPRTEFIFVTINPECPSVVSAQARWERLTDIEITERILETKEKIEKLKKKDVNVNWEGRSTTPSFRVVIINHSKLFVSFYEEGKMGPQCEQLELDSQGLLGKWFSQYFEKSRVDAKIMRLERTVSNYLFSKIRINNQQMMRELKAIVPEEDYEDLERIVINHRNVCSR